MTERKERFGETMKRPALERQARSGPGGNEETAGEKGGQRGSRINSYKDLRVYQNAMEAAMKVFDLTKTFPTEERYSMVDQARRASRSVCTNVAEGWRKRRYKAAFIAKLNDSEAEASETQVWIEFARRCGYLVSDAAAELDAKYEHILGQLVKMIDEPEKWLIK